MNGLTRATTRVCMRPVLFQPFIRCISQQVSVSQHKDHEQAIQLQKLSKGAKEGEVQRTAADDNKERLLQVVKETVKTQLEVFNREKAKKEEEERYANTIKEIMYKTGKTVPPRAPRVYTIVRPREKKQKMREQINEVLLSKFHKHTPIEEVKSFLEVVGLHPKKIELETKPSAQWLNAYVTLPQDEMLTALKMQRLYFKYGQKIVFFLTSPRAQAAFLERKKVEHAQRRAERADAAKREAVEKAAQALRMIEEDKKERAARENAKVATMAEEERKEYEERKKRMNPIETKKAVQAIDMAIKKKKKRREDPI